MSDPQDRKTGLFGRLFGGRQAQDKKPPEQKTEAPTAPTETTAPGEQALPEESPLTPSESDKKAPPEPVPETQSEAPPLEDEVSPAPVAESAPEPSEVAEPAPKQSWFQRLRGGLSKTSGKLSEGITSLFSKRKLDGATLEDLEDLLIQSDLGVDTAMRITETISKGRFQKGISAEEVKTILATEVEQVLRPVARPLEIDRSHKPHVVLMVGVNGTGKTTTIGKLAQRFHNEGLSVMLAAGDTFRAAAIDQLKVWGERTGAPVIARNVGADASGLAY
ncbi:MAG: signal recognition particle receptor subunit alpha, partial [Hyphomicrobiaceae bacterium]